MSKYRVISGPYFPLFRLNTEKHRQEITPYLGNFHAVYSMTANVSPILPYTHELTKLTNKQNSYQNLWAVLLRNFKIASLQ